MNNITKNNEIDYDMHANLSAVVMIIIFAIFMIGVCIKSLFSNNNQNPNWC